MAKNDIRIRLLKELRNLNQGTEEFVANEFLSKLHPDLGTIRRLLIELIDFDLIRESNVPKDNKDSSVIRNIPTTKDDSDTLITLEYKKSSKRLVSKYGAFEKIKDIRLTITVKGLILLKENEKLDVDYTLSKWQKYWFWPVALIAIAGLAIAIISLAKPKENKEINQPNNKKIEIKK